MISQSYGDMSLYTALRLRNATLKSDVSTLSQELTTGRTSDITSRLGGDLSYLSGIEHTLNKLESYQVAASEAASFASSIQFSMEKVQQSVIDTRDDILTIGTGLNPPSAQRIALDARQDLKSAISALNQTIGGRSLFSGTATDSPALNDSDLLMSSLVTEVAGLVSSADIMTAVDDWFNDPAGFDAVMYTGSTDMLDPVEVGEYQEVSVGVLATDNSIKAALKGLALAALSEESGITMTEDVKVSLVKGSMSDLTYANDELIQKRADVGFAEGRIETSRTRNHAELTSLGITKNKMLEADPYETLSKLEEAQIQLESLYMVTKKSFDLSLLRYL